jgi:AcrR family transcriptional regulator
MIISPPNDITERQKEIITAAGHILTRSGVNSLTIKNLAAEMQFTEGAIYRHFKSKEEIVLALLAYLMQNLSGRLSPIARSDASASIKLQRLIDSQINFFDENPHFVVVVFSDGLLEETGKVNDAIAQIVATKSLYLRMILAQGQEEQYFTSDISTDELLHITLGTFRMLMFRWRISHFEFSLANESKKVFGALLKLIAP